MRWNTNRLDGIQIAEHAALPAQVQAREQSSGQARIKDRGKGKRNDQIDERAISPQHVVKHNIRADWLKHSEYVQKMQKIWMMNLDDSGILKYGKKCGTRGRLVAEAPYRNRSGKLSGVD